MVQGHVLVTAWVSVMLTILKCLPLQKSNSTLFITVYLFKGYAKKKASRYFCATVLLGHPFGYLQVCNLFRASAEVSALCFEEIDGRQCEVGLDVLTVSQGFIGISETSTEIQKLNYGMEK